MNTATADHAWQAASPAGPAAAGQSFHSLIASVDRRWTLVRLAERASAGWAAGLVASFVLLAAGTAGGIMLLVPPVVLSFVAGACRRRRAASVVADRLDHVFGTKELFGTAARVMGAPEGPLLAMAADDAAVGLSAAEVPLARFRRWWWAVVLVATAALAAWCWMAAGTAELRPGGGVGSGFAARGTLLSSDPDARTAERAGTDGLRDRRPAESQSGAMTIKPVDEAKDGTSRTGDGRPTSGAGNASSAEGTGAATSISTARPDQSDGRGPEAATPGEARDAGNGGDGPAGDGSAGGEAGPGETSTPRPQGTGQTTTGVGGGDEVAPERRVPAEYRELVRRYFSGGK